MNTLIIYDNTGYIISQANGSLREPKGIPFIWVEVPTGKYVESIDVSVEIHTPIFVDLPKSEVDQLKERLELMQQALDDLIIGGAL